MEKYLLAVQLLKLKDQFTAMNLVKPNGVQTQIVKNEPLLIPPICEWISYFLKLIFFPYLFCK